MPRLGQNSRMKTWQEEGRGDAKYPDRGGKGGEMTVTVCDAVNGIDWKTKVSTEGSKKAP